MQCEALKITGRTGYVSKKRGDLVEDIRCPDEAEYMFNGRHVCWQHLKAAQNKNRKEPVEFVERRRPLVR